MKNLICLLILAIVLNFSNQIMAQDGIHYQAVARDGSGNLISNSNITVKFSIFSGTGGSLMIYSETHSTTTNAYGVFNLSIGKGTSTLGNFSTIDWGGNEHHLQVELSTGSGFVDMGTFPFETVPYAKTATDMSIKDMKDVDLTGVTSGNVLQYDGSVWKPGSGGGTGGGVWTQSGPDIYYNGGNVGIGKSSPSADLDILSKTNNVRLILTPTIASGGSSEIHFNESNGLLTKRFRIKNDGQDNRLKFIYGILTTPAFDISSTEVKSYNNFFVQDADQFFRAGTNNKIALINTNSSGGGGEIRIFNGTGPRAIELSGTEGSNNGGVIKVYENGGKQTIELDGDYGNLGSGYFSMYNNSQDVMMELISTETASNGSAIKMYQYNGKKTIELDGDYSSYGSGSIELFNDNEESRIKLIATETATQGATMKMYNDTGKLTIELDADFNGGGRIIADEIEIKGGADLAEYFDISSSKNKLPEAGMIVSIDPEDPGKLMIAQEAYDKKVAGVISGANGVKPGMKMGQSGSIADGAFPVALTGRVYVLAETSKGKIKPGDLICSSDKPGYAMKVKNNRKAKGAIIGKAISGLDDGEGYILLLVSLQ